MKDVIEKILIGIAVAPLAVLVAAALLAIPTLAWVSLHWWSIPVDIWYFSVFWVTRDFAPPGCGVHHYPRKAAP